MSKINLEAVAAAAAFAMSIGAYNLTAIAAGTGGERRVAVLVENVTTDTTLKLGDGRAISAHISPGMYVVLSDGSAAFEPGKPASAALKRQAEEGDPRLLAAALKDRKGVREAGTFMPGKPFTVTARPGDRIVFTTMFVQSNDLFYAPDPRGLPLFDASGRIAAGDVTKDVLLWDAGTEVNEAPGLGPNQAPRQSGPNSGPAEGGAVRPVNDGFTYPAVADVIRVTFSAK